MPGIGKGQESGKQVKNYSSKSAKRGRVAYRTPSRFIAQKSVYRVWDRAARLEYRKLERHKPRKK